MRRWLTRGLLRRITTLCGWTGGSIVSVCAGTRGARSPASTASIWTSRPQGISRAIRPLTSAAAALAGRRRSAAAISSSALRARRRLTARGPQPASAPCRWLGLNGRRLRRRTRCTSIFLRRGFPARTARVSSAICWWSRIIFPTGASRLCRLFRARARSVLRRTLPRWGIFLFYRAVCPRAALFRGRVSLFKGVERREPQEAQAACRRLSRRAAGSAKDGLRVVP